MHWDWERFPGSNINAPDCALDSHWLTDSPPIATDKCKLSLNSVNCKYVNSKLRLPAAREQCADWCWWIPSQIQTEVLRHFRPGDFRQETFYDNVTVQIFSDKSIEVTVYRVYLPRYTTLFITNDYFANSRTDAWQLQCVQPSDTRWQPGWPAWTGQVKLTRIWVTRCTSAWSHADTGEARRGGIKQTDTWDEAVMELPH